MANLETANNFAYHVGRRVGPYKLEGILGRGAMAEVYKSTHPNLNRDVAVKILHPFHTQVPGFIQRFRHEAQAAASLHHSNIVQVYDFSVTEDGLYYMVMQYINGLSLEEYLSLEKKPLSLAKTFHFFRQIANALSFAHQLDTIHRDVKPANIMLDTRENAYLSDFGLAKIIGVTMQTQSGLGPGTPDYMAPEQVEGKNLSASADIYAMGVILYRMLTKNFPYTSDSWISIIKAKTSEAPIPPHTYLPDISWGVEEVILRALARDPADRFPDMASMLTAFETAVVEEIGEVPGVTRTNMMGVVPLPGVTIENYKIKREFTRDSAKIYQRYLAHNVALDSMGVLNILKTPADDESSFIKDFQARMDALTLLDHPGIAAITRVDVTKDNQPYIAYEYVPGLSLELEIANWKKEGKRLEPETSLTLIKELAEALQVAHKVDVIHNDLRPENIVINEAGQPVLVGLEIPIAPDYLTINRNSNTVDYASPEQLNGQSLSAASNIYSLGIILYHLLSGNRPRIPLSWDWSNEDLPRGVPLDHAVNGLTQESYDLVECCIQELPERRFQDLESLIAALDEAILAEQNNDFVAAAVVEGDEPEEEVVADRRRWVLAAPLLLLLLIPLFFVVRNQLVAQDTAVTSTPIAGLNAVVTATPVSTETATHTPTSRYTGSRIQIAAPNSGARFLVEDEIPFSWIWPVPIEDDHVFVVYLLDGEEESVIGEVAGSEVGSNNNYLLRTAVSNLIDHQPGAFSWQIRLEDKDSGELFEESAQFPLVFENPTQTPTPIPSATPTASATSTPEIVECIPPDGWVEYFVQEGDTLFTLAVATFSTVEEIKQANCMEDNVLSVNGSLWLAQTPPTPTPTPTNTPIPTNTRRPVSPPPRATTPPTPPTATIPPPPTATSSP